MKTRFLCSWLAACLLSGAAAAAESIDFELPSLNGDMVRLSDFRGDWVVLNYWATWCAPCREEIPDFSRMYDAHDDIVVLGLAFEDTEPEDFVRFLEQYPASYPILLVDTFDPPESLGAPRALPTTFLVNREGAIVSTWLGHITSTLILEFIDEHGR